MNTLIPFEASTTPSKVPATIAARFQSASKDLIGNAVNGGFPVVSIKGKVFHIVRGDERTLVKQPGQDDPAGSIEVIILKANPSNSKNFYREGYIEGSTDKPTCYSPDGIAPAIDAEEPQSKKCATCPHNQWGSKISNDGKKGRACSDSRRLAVSTFDTPADPMLLRVPAASMKSLVEYGKILAARGIPHEAVVTKIGFDYTVAHPQLTFRPVAIIADPTKLDEIAEVAKSELAAQIVGTMAMPESGSEANADLPVIAAEAPAPAPAPAPVAPKPAAKAKPAPAETPKAKPAEKPAASEGLAKSIESLLGEMSFDDE